MPKFGLQAVSSLMFSSQMEFFAKLSAENPAFGGTYMTLLNTIANLGGSWPTPLALYLVGEFTTKTCTGEAEAGDAYLTHVLSRDFPPLGFKARELAIAPCERL